MNEMNTDKQSKKSTNAQDGNKKVQNGWRGQQPSRSNTRLGGTFKGATKGIKWACIPDGC